MPIGASFNTQPMITSIASVMLWNRSVSRLRDSASSRVIAKAKASVNTVSGRNASPDAAATTLVGTIVLKKSASVGTLPITGAAVSAARSACDHASGNGQASSSSGITAADISVVPHSTTTNSATARPAIRPARAASAVAAIPVTSSPTISGTITICKPCSHASPIGWVTVVTASAASRFSATPRIPSAMPATSARRIRVACDIGFLGASGKHENA